MKRYLLGSLVGAILLFGWQSVAHMFLHYHDVAYKQVANQENVIQNFSTIFKEEGQYLIPAPDPKASQEEMEKFAEGMKGKPWAMVIYHPTSETNMGTAVLRSFCTAFLSVLIFIWILGKSQDSGTSIFLKSLALGFIMFMFVWYNQNIWMHVPWDVIKGELIDLLIGWGLCGVWLGWFLKRRDNPSNRLTRAA